MGKKFQISVYRELPDSFEQPHAPLLYLFNQTHVNEHLECFHSFIVTNAVIIALLLTCVSESTGESPGGIIVLLEGMCLVIVMSHRHSQNTLQRGSTSLPSYQKCVNLFKQKN